VKEGFSIKNIIKPDVAIAMKETNKVTATNFDGLVKSPLDAKYSQI
jgi:hypothetical protein